MSQVNAALLEESGKATFLPRPAVGDPVRAKAGTPDPDFPYSTLDGWAGVVVEADYAAEPPRFLVQWDESTMGKMSPHCRADCRSADFVLEQMWLVQDDLDPLPA